MKKDNKIKDDDNLRADYDLSKLSGGVRGKYVDRYRESTNIVHLEVSYKACGTVYPDPSRSSPPPPLVPIYSGNFSSIL